MRTVDELGGKQVSLKKSYPDYQLLMGHVLPVQISLHMMHPNCTGAASLQRFQNAAHVFQLLGSGYLFLGYFSCIQGGTSSRIMFSM